MRHHEVDWMDDYLDGALQLDLCQDLERHVAGCRSCATALQEMRDARACLKWLVPLEASPQPGPEFYSKVRLSIEKKADSGFVGNIAAMLQGPRLAYPLMFMFLGLLLTAWTFSVENEWSETNILGIPPARYSAAVSSEAERTQQLDMVMVSLVETLEGN